MNVETFRLLLDTISSTKKASAKDYNVSVGSIVKGIRKARITGRSISYDGVKEDDWVPSPYNLEEIQVAQDTDSYIFKAIQIKVNRLLLAGWSFVGRDKSNVDYIRRRVAEIEIVSGIPFPLLIAQTAADLLRYSNCMWVKVRAKESSSGKPRALPSGLVLEPVAGYFVLPFETLKFRIKRNGELKRVMQEVGNDKKEFAPYDVIHFYSNRKPGFSVGTPELVPVVDDVRLLRKIEEEVEELIDGALQPIFHWKVGTDQMPEVIGPDGVSETQRVRKMIEYVTSSGVYVTDHRHDIKAIGAEGRALSIGGYLDYFRKRAFAGLSVSPVDMGDDNANRASATVLSKIAAQHVETLQFFIKVFVDNFVIRELLAERGDKKDYLSEEEKVEIVFGTVDKEERAKVENQAIQLWTNNLLSLPEVRNRLGETPFTPDDFKNTFFKLYEEPLALIKALGLPIADMALANAPTSAITKEGVAAQREEGQQGAKKAVTGRPENTAGTGQRRASKAKSRPSNQRGVRTAPKFTPDLLEKKPDLSLLDEEFSDGVLSINGDFLVDVDYNRVEDLKKEFQKEYRELMSIGRKRMSIFESVSISKDIVLSSLQFRLDQLYDKYLDEAFALGEEYGKNLNCS